MAHFDVHGEVAPHVRRHIEALRSDVDRVIVVSTAELTDDAYTWLDSRVELSVRPNYGYDFLSWRMGLLAVEDLEDYDEVIICNDSFVGPLTSYAHIFDQMAARPVDFWGFTMSHRVAPHVQSFFVVFRRWLVRSQAFQTFWESLKPTSERRQVILQQEVGLSRNLIEAGFASGAYFEASDEDQKIARARMRWWAAHRHAKGHTRPPAHVLEARSNEDWNPAIALADCALDGRLPYVKIDTLRYDPYGLGAGALLAACEGQFPDHFSGVRTFLQRTAEFYPMRPEEVLMRTPYRWRPYRRLVRYRCVGTTVAIERRSSAGRRPDTPKASTAPTGPDDPEGGSI